MAVSESDALIGALSSLKEIVDRSPVQNPEIVQLLSQIESTIFDIDRKTKKPSASVQPAFVGSPTVTPVVV